VVARLVTQVAHALQAVHMRGWVHGDLKLSNLFVRTAPTGGPLAAVSDFGQAVAVEAAAEAAAQDERGWVERALQCAAPEQLTGRATPASDQYALATVAYYLLTGRYPFAGQGRALGLALLQESPTPPSQLDPLIPAPAEAALLRALAKAPEARFPDITTFAHALSDGLSAAASPGAGVTQQFSLLSGGARSDGSSAWQAAVGSATGSIPARARPDASGVRRPPISVRLRNMRGRPVSPRLRAAGAIAGIALLALLIAGGVGLHALATSDNASSALPNFGGLDYAPTLTPNAAQSAQARQTAAANEQLLTAATAASPVFTDSLASNTQHWATDGKQVFFGNDAQLHIYNQTARQVVSVNQPIEAPPNFVVTLDMTFLRGSVSDLAGVRVRVVRSADGSDTHDTALISPEGRYEIWRFAGSQWSMLDSGYTDAVKRGLGQTNHLALLARGADYWFFVNGHFVTQVRGTAATSSGTMGPTVIYSGTEVGFAHYVVYQVKTP
jgi:hypothetical protein